MEQIYKDRINALADLIEKQPVAGAFSSEGFNMNRWKHICGTPSCIAGWACHMEGDVPESAHEVWLKASEYLGLEDEDESLFLAYGVSEDITPSQAATTLRKLAETGKVDWSHVKVEL